MKKLIIAGGTGFLGKALISKYEHDFDEIIILSRSANTQLKNVRYVQWDAKSFGSWCFELEGATAIINLCGKSVDCRYTEKNKALIFSSRLDSTQIIGEAILKCIHSLAGNPILTCTFLRNKAIMFLLVIGLGATTL